MDEQTGRGNQYTYLGIRKTRTINILTMDDAFNISTKGRTDRETRAFNIPTMDKDRKVQSIYQRLTKRQTRVTNTV